MRPAAPPPSFPAQLSLSGHHKHLEGAGQSTTSEPLAGPGRSTPTTQDVSKDLNSKFVLQVEYCSLDRP